MSTDYRTLCAELVNLATVYCKPDDDAVGHCAAVLTRARAALAQPEPEGGEARSFLHALRLAKGCHDYSGGHDGANLQAFHDGIGTVVEVLKRAAVAGPWDSQTRAVFAAGSSGAATLIVPPTLIQALELAEAGLADIGDAEREPGDDLAWAEARAARDLSRIRQALNLWRDQASVAPVAWCRSDEFANAMNRGGSFNGWRDPGAGVNKCDMQLYAIPPARHHKGAPIMTSVEIAAAMTAAYRDRYDRTGALEDPIEPCLAAALRAMPPGCDPSLVADALGGLG